MRRRMPARGDRAIARSVSAVLAVSVVLASCSSGPKGPSADGTAVTTAASTAAATSAPSPEQRHVSAPKVTGPVTGPGNPWNAVASVPDDAGYTTEEYFVSGDATSYRATGTIGTDGRWDAEPDGTAPYTTRILVYRPADVADFNGTVVLEWFNVSAGFETAPDFLFTHRELLRSGYAWVGVSAQQAGIEAGGDDDGVLGIQPLKGMNPERYDSLHHPGDEYSYDIFTQASAAVRATGAGAPLDGYDVERVVADGESQSAFRMTTYINAVQPLTHAFDGFLVHSRWAEGTPLNPSQTPPGDAILRTDTSVPVMQVQSETDVPRYLDARQDDGAHIRTWEIAGTAHVDENVLANAMGCTTPPNSGPEIYVMAAALSGLNAWIDDPAAAPAKAARIEIDAAGAIERDEHGNALGGVRTPQLDVPIATLSGEGGQGPDFCRIAGVTEPFGLAEATSLYGTKDAYLDTFAASMNETIGEGFLLRADAPDMQAAAAEAWPAS